MKLGTILIIAMVVPATVAQAQTAGGFNLGIADRADTSALEVTLRLAWGHETGPALEGSAGVDWAIGHGTPYDILDADVGYAAIFGAQKRMRVVIRGGASWWGRNDRTDGLGENGAVELQRFGNPHRGVSLAMTWRRFAGFTVPSLTAGLILR